MTTPTPMLLDPTTETWALEIPGKLTQEAASNLRDQLREAMPGKRVVIVGDGAHFRSLDSLDAAWAEAEAALPEGWGGLLVGSRGASVLDANGARVQSEGPTPAAALRSLAIALRARP